MMSSRKAAFLVGISVILASAWVVALVIYLRGSLATQRAYWVEAVFEDAQGIRPQARVYLAGVEVGEVQDVMLTPDFRARVRLAIRKDVVIPEDTVAVVASPGLAGVDRLISLLPGKSPRPVREGTILKGIRQPSLTDVAPVAQQALLEVQQLVQSANRWLNDPQLEASLKQTLSNLEVTSARLIALSEQTSSLLKGMERSVDTLTLEARQPIRNLSVVMKDLQTLLQRSSELVTTAQQAIQHIERLATDEQMLNDLRTTTTRMRELSERLNRIAEDVSLYTGDEQLRENLRVAVAEARATLTEARQATTNINRFVERLVQPRGVSVGTVDFSLDLLSELQENTFRTDFTVSVPYREGRYFYVGLYDITESNRIIAQYGSALLPTLNLRYGLYASKPGVGLDWNLRPGLQLRADLFNPNDLQMDLRAKIRLTPDWNLWVGVERLLDENRPVFGVQISR